MRGARPKRALVRRAAVVMSAAVAAAAATPAAAAPAERDNPYPLHRLSDGVEVERSTLTLVRTDSGVSFTVATSGLVPGHAYTVWVMIFNRPQFCANPPRDGLRCGLEDLGSDLVGASVTYGAGNVVGGAGRASFAGRQAVGDTSTALFGPGLTDARGAEVQVRIRDHGPAVPGLVDDQVHTFNGGCDQGQPNEGLCEDVQTSGA